MSGAGLERIAVGGPERPRAIAVLHRPGSAPGLFWLGGLKSDMEGTKAEALDRWAGETGRSCTRFDYSGHGRSAGRFEDGTISLWLEEAEAVFDRFTDGPQILVGSSMGGWLALLLARRLNARGEAARLAGMVLIAPAFDMTQALMWDSWDEAARRDLVEKGFYAQPS
ncbi:MAG TPA: alpha/beta hydrolase, partial [Afifellaceae bacterium]|nr:alpha/beta hydrolase [Afifellaceae bacterium]